MNVIIASGKGGTGKTLISTNLTSFISRYQRVVLSDLDVEEPNSNLFITGKLIKKEDKYKMIPEWDKDKCQFCGQCQQNCNFNAILCFPKNTMVLPDLCHSCNACSELCTENALPMVPEKMGELKHFNSGNIDFVESRLAVGKEQAVPLIVETKEYVEKNFPENIIKIFDSPPGTSCPVVESLSDGDLILLVTEPTPFGFHDLKLAIDVVLQLKKKFGVIINRDGVGNDDVENYCNEKGYEIIAKIPQDIEIAKKYSKGELVYDKFPKVKNEFLKIENFILKNGNNGELK